MSLLSFRVELLPGLELHWHFGMSPTLAVTMSDEERRLLTDAGGPERWRCLEAPLPPIRGFIFEKVPLRPDGRIALTRLGGGRLKLIISFSRKPILTREYPEQIIHAALRVAGHGTALSEVVTSLRDTDYLNLRPGMQALVSGKPAAAASDDDPEREAWEAVWAEEARIKPAPATDEVPPETALAAPPPATPEPAPQAAAPEPPKPEPEPIVAPRVFTPKPPAVEGPLRAPQIRLYVQTLREHGRLPEGLSEAARKQVMAHAEL